MKLLVFSVFFAALLSFASAKRRTIWRTGTIYTTTETSTLNVVSTQTLTQTVSLTESLKTTLSPIITTVTTTSTSVIPSTVYTKTATKLTTVIQKVSYFVQYGATTTITVPASTEVITRTLNLDPETTTYFFTTRTVPVTTAPSLLFCYNLV